VAAGQPLPDREQLGQRFRCPLPERPGLPHQPPRHGAVIAWPAAGRALGIQQFQEITGGDLGECPALGGHDDRRPPDGRVPRSRCDGAVAEDCAQPAEPGLVTGPLEVAAQGAGTDAGGGQPVQARAHDAGADPEDQPDRQQVHALPGADAAGVHPGGAVLLPVLARVLGTAGQPPLLPRAARVGDKPVQRQVHAADLPVAGAGIRRGERRPGDQAQDRVVPETGSQPFSLVRAGGEPGARGVPRRLPGLTPQPHRRGHLALQGLVQPGGHETPVPNSTPSVSGR